MSQNGPQFYDDQDVFATYQARREREDNPNDTLERPVMLELLGSISELEILDLGCGHAGFGLELLALGASSYLGIDGSKNMIEAAKTSLAGTNASAIQADIQTWKYPSNRFDLVVSSLVLHYIENLDSLLEQIHACLRPNGRFIFSVLHPVISSSNNAFSDVARQDWIVDDYFHSGKRINASLGSEVTTYHRTLENYFNALQMAGFTIKNLRESQPKRKHFLSEETFQRRQRIPLFLFFEAHKT